MSTTLSPQRHYERFPPDRWRATAGGAAPARCASPGRPALPLPDPLRAIPSLVRTPPATYTPSAVFVQSTHLDSVDSARDRSRSGGVRPRRHGPEPGPERRLTWSARRALQPDPCPHRADDVGARRGG